MLNETDKVEMEDFEYLEPLTTFELFLSKWFKSLLVRKVICYINS